MPLDRKKVLAVVLTVALVTSAIVYYETGPFHMEYNTVPSTHNANLSLGPRLIVNYPGYSGSNSTSTSITTIQVFAAVPNAFNVTGKKNLDLKSVNISSNSRYVELLNSTISGNRSVQFLSGNFNSISNQWKYLFSNSFISSKTSLTVLAYTTVYNGSAISVFSYYDNIQYQPDKIELFNSTSANATLVANWFNGSIISPSSYYSVSYDNMSLNLSIAFSRNPSQVFDAQSTGKYSYETYAVPQFVNYTDRKDMHSDVILPLVGMHLSTAVSSGNSLIDFYSEFPSLNDGLYFNSANVFKQVSGGMSSVMSIAPSFSSLGGSSTSLTFAPLNVTPKFLSENNGISPTEALNRTTGVSGISGMTYTFVHYAEFTQIYREKSGSRTGLPVKIFDGNGTITQVSAVENSEGPVFKAFNVPPAVDSLIQGLMEGSSNGSVRLNDSGLLFTYFGATLQSHYPGYSSASNALERLSGAVSTFSTSLGLGLAVSDALSVLNSSGPSEPQSAIASESAGMINGTIGLSATSVSMMSTIGYVYGYFPGGLSYEFSNVPVGASGSSYNIRYYESPYPVSFTDSTGATYSFYAPTDYLNATGILN